MNGIRATLKERIMLLEPGTVFLTGEFSDLASKPTLRNRIIHMTKPFVNGKSIDTKIACKVIPLAW